MPYKKCLCRKTPVFNFPGETKPICCKGCKTNDMINVIDKRCSCGSRPSFNVIGETKPICCKDCKTIDMVNVVNKRCSCGIRPSFNIPGQTKPICCKVCKTDEMVDVVSKSCLCGKQPAYNIPYETKPIFCSKCKTNDMINIVSKVCPGYISECPVRTYLSNGHKYCMSCDPNDARRKQYKRFEEEFFDYVKDKIDIHKREFVVAFAPNETAKKFARLDGIVFGDDVIVCIEVDENNHQEYECDEHRMHLVTAELLQKYLEHNVSWVRVNPTIDAKSQWSKSSITIREKRFKDVVTAVDDILKTRDTRVVYIGFD